MSKHSISDHGALISAIGLNGFEVLNSEKLTSTGNFYAILAVNGNVVLGSCSVSQGESPISGHIIKEGNVLFAPFKNITIQSGIAYIYKL